MLTLPTSFSRYSFPADFRGMESDAGVIGYWCPSHGSPYLQADYVLAANLVRDHNPSKPVLYSVAFNRHPCVVAEGERAKELFRNLVITGSVESPTFLEMAAEAAKPGELAIRERENLHREIVKLAMAAGIPVENFASTDTHLQYLELCARLLAKVQQRQAQEPEESGTTS